MLLAACRGCRILSVFEIIQGIRVRHFRLEDEIARRFRTEPNPEVHPLAPAVGHPLGFFDLWPAARAAGGQTAASIGWAGCSWRRRRRKRRADDPAGPTRRRIGWSRWRASGAADRSLDFGSALAICMFKIRSGRNRLLRIERRKALDHGYPAEFLVGRDKHRYQAGPF